LSSRAIQWSSGAGCSTRCTWTSQVGACRNLPAGLACRKGLAGMLAGHVQLCTVCRICCRMCTVQGSWQDWACCGALMGLLCRVWKLQGVSVAGSRRKKQGVGADRQQT
jgi:hypothetical protein